MWHTSFNIHDVYRRNTYTHADSTLHLYNIFTYYLCTTYIILAYIYIVLLSTIDHWELYLLAYRVILSTSFSISKISYTFFSYTWATIYVYTSSCFYPTVLLCRGTIRIFSFQYFQHIFGLIFFSIRIFNKVRLGFDANVWFIFDKWGTNVYERYIHSLCGRKLPVTVSIIFEQCCWLYVALQLLYIMKQ